MLFLSNGSIKMCHKEARYAYERTDRLASRGERLRSRRRLSSSTRPRAERDRERRRARRSREEERRRERERLRERRPTGRRRRAEPERDLNEGFFTQIRRPKTVGIAINAEILFEKFY